MTKEQQIQLQTRRKEIASQIKQETKISPAAKALMENNDKRRVIDMRNYAESRGINLDNKELYNSIDSKKFNNTDISKQLPKNDEFEL